MRLQIAFHLAAFLATLSSYSLFAQVTIVSPGEYTDSEAPNAGDVSGFPSYRFQQVYSAEDFAAAGEGPYTITRIDWRPGSEMIETIDYPSERFIMKFATTNVDPSLDGLAFDPTFANNINGNDKLVFDSPITMTTANSGPAEGPKAFDYGLDLSAPYFYDPSAGNLLMDLTVINGQGPLLLDFVNSPTDSSTTRMLFAGSADAESSTSELGGHVLQFTVENTPPTPFFWDEFDRTDLYDTNIKYSVDSTPEEEYEIVEGSLIVTSLVDNLPAVGVHVPNTPDFTLKTQARILDVETCAINPFLGLFGRDFIDGRNDSYWGGGSSDGRVFIGEEPVGIHSEKDRYSCEDVKNNDVHMELRIVGESIEFTSWLDGTARPDEPDLVMSDGTLTANEVVGVFINPSAQLENFALRYLAFLPAFTGDYNASNELDAEDIDLLSAEVRSAENNRAFDLNDDATVDQADRLVLINDLLNTYLGDSNLDGEFNSTDFVQIFQAGEYEDGVKGNSTWATGDWDGDGDFDSGDFVVAFQSGGYEKGPRAGLLTVPEPRSITLIVVGLIVALFGGLRTQRCCCQRHMLVD